MYSHVISSKFTAEVLIGTLRVAVGHGHLILSEQRIDVCFLISSDLAGLRLWIIKVTPRHTVRQKGPGPAGAHIPLSMKINATVSSNRDIRRFKLREQLFTVVSNTIQVVIDIHNYDQACNGVDSRLRSCIRAAIQEMFHCHKGTRFENLLHRSTAVDP